MVSKGQGDVTATEAAEALPETSLHGPPTTQRKSQQELEETPIDNNRDERPEAQPQSDSSEFEFQDAHVPLDVCFLR